LSELFTHCDELGPAKVIHINEPRHKLRAIVVVDNVSAGPSIGGVRMADDASLDECLRLARAMTLKNASAGLAHGGGKSVILADPAQSAESKERLMRAFACAIADVSDYIPGPDMGTDERCMAYVHDEIGRAVGLPAELGGIPLDEIGATGFGLAVAVRRAFEHLHLNLRGARVVVQGFGSVGQHSARFLHDSGAVLIAASDSRGCIVNPDGLDLEALMRSKRKTGAVSNYTGGEARERDAVIDVDCEIWIPAARPDVITADNVDRLSTRVVAQGANIGVTVQAERALQARGVLCIPDFIANAGGVICAAVEYHGGTRTQAFQAIEETVSGNVGRLLLDLEDAQRSPRDIATGHALERVQRAASFRR
jgi:glutamate dehydrogenase (NAD(P)+)